MSHVSLKGDRDSVFLREAQLLGKDKLLLLKEKTRALVAVPPFPRRFPPKTDVDSEGDEASKEGSAEEDGEDWTDVDSFLSDGDGEDDWSDEEDDVPPDFDDADNLTLEGRKQLPHNGSASNRDKVLLPVFPHGRPRERW